MSIGDNIKKWRELRNLKQSELAEMLGVSDKTVSSWEINRTEPKMGMFEKISSALNCKKTDIIGIEDDTEDSQLKILCKHSDGYGIFIEPNFSDDSSRIKRLFLYYSALNDIGKKKAMDNLEDLVKIYSNNQTTNILNAAHSRTDIPESERTEAAKQQEEDIMDDPDF